MSFAELRPWFPSASHPALPTATSILSTLRHLTGPGKGNELKPEERTALIGVSALLGCERVQNKDLVEKTAQKASSVAPAHFRSALRLARVLLAEHDNQVQSGGKARTSSPRRSTRGDASFSTLSAEASPTRSTSNAGAGPSEASAGDYLDPLTPFQTPKKKFKYSSGVDLSGLIRHSPSKGSPLKQSVTPSRAQAQAGSGTPRRTARSQGRAALVDEVEGEEGDEDAVGAVVPLDRRQAGEGYEDGQEEEVLTPTKKRRPLPARSTAQIDSAPTTSAVAAAVSAKRASESVSAFLALRPGAAPQAELADERANRNAVDTEDDFELALRSKRRRRAAGAGAGREMARMSVRRQRDWTYRELKWTAEEVARRHEAVMTRLEELLDSQERRE